MDLLRRGETCTNAARSMVMTVVILGDSGCCRGRGHTLRMRTASHERYRASYDHEHSASIMSIDERQDDRLAAGKPARQVARVMYVGRHTA